MPPTYPRFQLDSLGIVRMKDGHPAIIWKATTTHHGQDYTLAGPLKASVLALSTRAYVDNPDDARDILTRRLPEHMAARGANL
jgi:hypothetical protein